MTSSSPNTPKTYQRSRFHRAENLLTRALTRVGVIPRSYVLTTVGRKSGQERRNPVTVVDLDGRRWLVAPYGVVPWVLNARAAGEVRLTRRLLDDALHGARGRAGGGRAGAQGVRHRRQRAAAVLRATVDDPPEAFAREADRHPVMELVPVHDAVVRAAGTTSTTTLPRARPWPTWASASGTSSRREGAVDVDRDLTVDAPLGQRARSAPAPASRRARRSGGR